MGARMQARSVSDGIPERPPLSRTPANQMRTALLPSLWQIPRLGRRLEFPLRKGHEPRRSLDVSPNQQPIDRFQVDAAGTDDGMRARQQVSFDARGHHLQPCIAPRHALDEQPSTVRWLRGHPGRVQCFRAAS